MSKKFAKTVGGQREIEDEVFLDRNPKIFELLLDYLRNNK